MVASATFWDSRAEKYDSEFAFSVEGGSQRNRRLAENLRDARAVLDFGCGNGGISLCIAEYVDEIVGLDVSSKMIHFAEQRKAEAGVDNITFQAIGESEFPIFDTQFDVVLGLSVLHLVPDPQGTLAWFRNILGSEGCLIIETPCLSDMSLARQLTVRAAMLLGAAPSIHSFSYNSLRDLLDQSGFFIEEEFEVSRKDRMLWCVCKSKGLPSG